MATGIIGDVLTSVAQRIDQEVDGSTKVVPVTVVTVSPLTVRIQGAQDASPAQAMYGSALLAGDIAYAIWWPGLVVPLVFRVDDPAVPGILSALGPAGSTDVTTADGVIVTTAAMPVIAGRWYRLTGYFVATQISAAGLPFIRVAVNGTATGAVEYRSGTAGANLSYAANQVVAGDLSIPWQATNTENVTARIIARTSAGGLRFAANSARIFIEDRH